MFGHIDFEEIDRVPHFAGAEHRIDCRQNHSGNGDNGLFFTSALGNSLIFQLAVRIVAVLYRSVSDLHQSRFAVNTGPGDMHRLFLSSGFVVAGSQSSLAAKPLGRAKLTHIRADFREDSN